MRTPTLRLPPCMGFPPLTVEEMSLLGELLTKDRISRSLRKRMEVEVKRQSSRLIGLRMPPESAAAIRRRGDWRVLIRGPIGGWERKGRRIRRKWDPAARRLRLSFALLIDSRSPSRANLLYDGDLFEWWIARTLVTGQIRSFFECWYCGKLTWRHRSSARFCNDRCRMRYHLAERNQEQLLLLPKGRAKRAYQELRRKGAEIGLIDMPIAVRLREEVRRRHHPGRLRKKQPTPERP